MSTSASWGRTARFSAPDTVLARQSGGETVLLDLQSEQYFGLTGAAGRLWELVQAPITFEALTATLQDEFDVDPARLDADITTTLTTLVKRGLVTVDDQ